MPRVSVVIPVYNSARLIPAALGSVFAQSFTDFEVIVVDDGSKDERELLDALAPWLERIVYVRQANAGPASARNTGIRRASGELIAFLDADDEWMPEKLAKQVAYFDRYPQTGLLHTATFGGTTRSGARPGPPNEVFCDLFHTRLYVNTLTVMTPRRVLEEVGGFDERREIHVEDWDLWLRIAARYPAGYLDERLAIHRPGGHMSRQVDQTYIGQGLVIEKNQHLCAHVCPRHIAAPADCLSRRRHVLHRDWGIDRLLAGDPDGAREELGRAFRLKWSMRGAMLYARSFLTRRAADARRQRAPDRRRRSPTPHRLSLVQDTMYRRTRQRFAGLAHTVDEAWAGRRRRGGTRRVLFDASQPVSCVIWQPLYERLRHDPRIELCFTGHADVWDLHHLFPADVADRVVPQQRAQWLKVDACINTDFWDLTWLYRRTRRVHLFHGVAGKYALDAPTDLAPVVATFDCLMFPNEDRRRRYIEAGLVPDDPVRAALVGYPKVDRLVDGSLDPGETARRLSLRRDRVTVLYAPTWSPHSSLNSAGEQIVDALAERGWQVVVKLHDRSYDPNQRASGGIDWAARLARYRTHPLVRVVDEADAAPYLMLADAMVTDHSSIGFEFMLLDRPLVVVDCPELIRAAKIAPDKVARLRAAARVADGVPLLAAAVQAELSDPSRLSAVRRRTARELFHEPGTATDRAVALIYDLIDLPQPDAVEVGATAQPAGVLVTQP